MYEKRTDEGIGSNLYENGCRFQWGDENRGI